jgi:hypothetical protein
MSLSSFCEMEDKEIQQEPKYSGIELLALEVLLNEKWKGFQ